MEKRAYTSEVGDALNRRIELHACRQQHTVLRHILGEFPTSEPFSGAHVMMLRERLRGMLVRHLRLEDEELYPQLSQSVDEHLRTTAHKFRVEMGGLVRAFEEFNRRWNDAATIDANPTAFMEQWTTLRKALELRMDAEDQGLYLHAEEYFTGVLRRAEAD